jgi:4-amino-4-deoxy-L-arabinose transferase-like glycosyltransferase
MGKATKILTKHPVIWIILLLSLVYRGWYANTHFSFAQDQARDLMMVKESAEKGELIVGYGSKASVSDFRWPPFYYQMLLTVGTLTNFNPQASAWVIVIIESLTPVLFYWLLNIFFPAPVAAAAATLYLFSPTTTAFATFSWNPNMILFFTVLSLVSFILYLVKCNPKYLVIGMAAAVLGMQLHFQAALGFLFVLGVFGWSVLKRRHDFKWWGIGLLVSSVFYLPYICAESLNGWSNTGLIIDFFIKNHPQIYDRVSKIKFILSFIPGFFERVFTGGNYQFIWLGRLTILLGGSYLAWITYTRKGRYLILSLLIISQLIMVRVYKGDKLDYYLSAIFILPFIFLSLILSMKRKVVWLLALFIAFRAGIHISHLPLQNDYRDLKQTMAVIKNSAVNNQVTILFHRQDLYYALKYAFDEEKLVMATPSATLVDVCELWQQCYRPNKLFCDSNTGAFGALDYVHWEKYNQIDKHQWGKYQIVISKILPDLQSNRAE